MSPRITLLWFASLAGPASAQVADWQKQFDAWYWKAPASRLENLRWSENGELLVFSERGSPNPTWKLVTCATGQIRSAFDLVKLGAAWAELTPGKPAPSKFPFTRVVPSEDGSFRLENDSEAWLLSKEGRLTVAKPGKPPEAPPSGRNRYVGREYIQSSTKLGERSPDGKWRVTLKEGNVLLAEEAKPESVRALTQEGTPQDGWVGPVSWAPDGRHFALWRERVVPVRTYTVVDSVKGTKKDIPYEKPGDDKTERRPWVFAIGAESPSTPDRSALPLTMNTDRLDWTADGHRLRSQFVKRGFTGHGLVEYSTETRRWRTLLSEEDPKFVYTYGSRFRRDLDERRTLWASERTGFNQLYLVDLPSGQTLHAVTSGPGLVKHVIDVDVKTGELLYIGLGRHPEENPYHHHLFRTDLQGRPPLDLTPGDAHHTVDFSPGRRYFIDTASRVDLAPTFTLRASADGRALATLASGNLDRLKAAGWQEPIRFHTKDREGKFDIWGVVNRPYPFDPGKKYPVLEHIYAGPQDSFVPTGFALWNNNHREPTLKGFYVVQIDGRGTWNRGREFHQEAWQNLKDAGFPDRIRWLREFAQREPAMDLGRVGIFGGSAGGQNTVHALLLHGDFYKAGAADCGCYDNRIDKLWWNEQWMGYPIGPAYAANSCATEASRLRGHLFLTVGESDTNVDVKCTYDLRDALLAAGKKDLFELEVVPGAGHGACEQPAMRAKRLQFFINQLQPPVPGR
jgi:dipeptidyl-peptidase-4